MTNSFGYSTYVTRIRNIYKFLEKKKKKKKASNNLPL